MKKLFIFSITILLTSSCTKAKYAPTHEDIEAIANAAIKKHINENIALFQLHRKSIAIRIDSTKLPYKQQMKTLSSYGFAKDLTADSTRIDWKSYSIDKAIIISNNNPPVYNISLQRNTEFVPFDTDKKIVDSLNLYDANNFYVPIKKSWTIEQIGAQNELYLKNYITTLSCLKSQTFSISTPVFSNDGTHALIQVSDFYSGMIYLAKKQNSQWTCEGLFHWMM